MIFHSAKNVILPAIICFFLFSCEKAGRKLKSIAMYVNEDTAKKLSNLSDTSILDFVYGKCLDDKIFDGSQYSFLEFSGSDSVLMKCEHPVCFKNYGDSLCYIQIRGIISDSENVVCKQLSLLMKYRKECWELASPIVTDTVVEPGKLAGIENLGPYTLLRYHKENLYGNEFVSANDFYLCFYKAHLFPKGNYPVENNYCREKNTAIHSRSQGILKVNYNDSLNMLEYYFCGVEKGIAKEEKNICIGDTSFNILSVNNHSDPPDTINFISTEKLKHIVFEIGGKK